MTMTDNEIIKALECCNGGDCEECEAIDECCCFPEKLIVEASGLIKRQKAKIERLENEKVLNSVKEMTEQRKEDGNGKATV